MKGILRRSAVMLAVGVWLVAVMAVLAPSAHANEGDPHQKVTICHRTESATNPYVSITVNINSLDDAGKLGGHLVHEGDIIPPYTFTDDEGTFSFDGQGDQSLLPDCEAPAITTTTTEVTTSTTSTTTLPSTTTTVVPSATTTTTVRRLTPPSKPVVSGPKPSTTVALSEKPTGSSLPFTGSDTPYEIALGLVFLGAGAGLVVSAKQHRKELP